jgi:antitoxin FitA
MKALTLMQATHTNMCDLDQIHMATLTIRNLEASIKDRLRVRAAQNGRSMEAELRSIITEAVEAPSRPPELNLYDRIRARFEPLGGVELDLPLRGPLREPPTFE